MAQVRHQSVQTVYTVKIKPAAQIMKDKYKLDYFEIMEACRQRGCCNAEGLQQPCSSGQADPVGKASRRKIEHIMMQERRNIVNILSFVKVRTSDQALIFTIVFTLGPGDSACIWSGRTIILPFPMMNTRGESMANSSTMRQLYHYYKSCHRRLWSRR